MAPRRQGRPADDGPPAPRRAVRADRAPGGDPRLALREPGATGPVAPARRRRLAHTRAGLAVAPVLPRGRARAARRAARRGARETAAVAPAGAARPGRVADRRGPRGVGHAPARAPPLLASESPRRPPGCRSPRRTARLQRGPAGLPPPARGLLRCPGPRERAPVRVLKRLAGAEVYLTLPGGHPEPEKRLRATEVSALVARFIAREFGGDRLAAVRESTARVRRALGVTGWTAWPTAERRAFAQMSPVAALITDLEKWTAAERRHLVRVLRAKGSGSERAYANLLDSHRRFQRSLQALVSS